MNSFTSSTIPRYTIQPCGSYPPANPPPVYFSEQTETPKVTVMFADPTVSLPYSEMASTKDVEFHRFELFQSAIARKRFDVVEDIISLFPEENFFIRTDISLFNDHVSNVSLIKAVMKSTSQLSKLWLFKAFMSAFSFGNVEALDVLTSNLEVRTNVISAIQKKRSGEDFPIKVKFLHCRKASAEFVMRVFPEFYQTLADRSIRCNDEVATLLIAGGFQEKVSLAGLTCKFILDNEISLNIGAALIDSSSPLAQFKALVVTPSHSSSKEELELILTSDEVLEESGKIMEEIRYLIDRYPSYREDIILAMKESVDQDSLPDCHIPTDFTCLEGKFTLSEVAPLP